MSVFGLNFSRAKSGDSSLLSDFGNAAKTAYGQYGSGDTLTQEGLGDLRTLGATYNSRLSDPLGTLGRGIFTRAKAGLQDDYSRTVNSGDAKAKQLAAQSGGSLTPEQVAALDASNRRSASEGLFEGTGAVANAEATATLNEANKLYDRLEGVGNTILSVGQAEKTRGLQSIISMLASRTGRSGSVSGGVSVSARAAKKDIAPLETEAALEAFSKLDPVVFTYRENDENHVGFIADDVPDLVAMPGRGTLHSMDFVAVLTKVVQLQSQTIQRLGERLTILEQGRI